MRKLKKLLSVILVTTIVFTTFSIGISVSAENIATETNETTESPLKIEVTTDKSSYGKFNVADITVNITNTSDDTIENISANAIFDDLAPVDSLYSETSKKVEELKPGENFSFSYKATLSLDNSDVGLFSKIILWFVRLFNDGYTVINSSSEDGEYISKTDILSFGNVSANNEIKAYYSENNNNDNIEFWDFYSSDYGVLVGTEQEISFYAELNNYDNVDYVSLYSDEGRIGQLIDNGEGIDLTANDGIFSGKIKMFSNSEKKINIWASYGTEESIKKEFIYYTKFTDDELNNYNDFIEELEEIVSDFYQATNGDEDCSELIDTVTVFCEQQKQKGNVIEYTKNSDSISILLKGKIEYLFIPYVYGRLSGGTSSSIMTVEPNENDFSVNFTRIISQISSYLTEHGYDGSHTVLGSAKLVDRAYSQLCFNYNSLENDSLPSLNSNIKNDDHYTNSQVSISNLKNIDRFKLLIWEGHGGYTTSYGSCLVTGEDATKAKNLNDYAYDIKLNNIICTTGYFNSNYIGATYAVTPKFFETYLKNIENSTVYLGACGSGKDSRLADSFITRGANCVLTYDESVSMIYETLFRTYLFNTLSTPSQDHSYPSINEAVEAVKNIVGTYDSETGANPKLFLKNDNEKYYLNPGTVSGTIKDSETGKPIEGATIYCEEMGTRYVTDKNGKFTIAIESFSISHTFEMSHEDYKRKRITVASNSYSLIEEITLERKDNSETEIKQYTISGTVKDEATGNAISGVTVEVVDNSSDSLDPVATVTTDSNGLFSIKLPYGSYSLSFHHDNYEYYGTTVNVDTNNIIFTKPILLTQKDTTLYCSISGTVEDSSTKNVIYGVSVKLISTENDNGHTILTTTTDENGLFSIEFPYGNYLLTFTHDSYEFYSRTLDINNSNDSLMQKLLFKVQPISLTPKKSTAKIPETAVKFNGHYYQYYEANSFNSWEEASDYCNSLGGYLATISSQDENDFLYSYIKSQNVQSAYFGLTDKESEGTWIWQNGEKSEYRNWHSGEPNSENKNENYAMFYYKYSDGTWNDGDGTGARTVGGKAGFICEWSNNLSFQQITGLSYPIKGQKYWVVFNEGYRNDRLELSTFDVSGNSGSPYVVWNGSLVAKSDTGTISKCNQFHYTDSEWLYDREYYRLSDKATNIVASNVDIYSSDGQLLIKATN